MAYQPAGGVAQVEFRCLGDEVPMENVLHFQYTTTGLIPQSALDELSEAMWDAFVINVIPIMNLVVELREVYAVDLTSETAAYSSFTGDGPVPGTRLFSAAAFSNCKAIKLSTGRRGRSGRGRIYTMGAEKGDHDQRRFNGTYINSALAAYTPFLGNAIHPDFTLCVLSRVTGGEPRNAGFAQIVTGMSVTNNRIDTQRGRLD